jgi:hypothetical protein
MTIFVVKGQRQAKEHQVSERMAKKVVPESEGMRGWKLIF